MTYKIFNIEDQNWFSKISGDYNPIHLDDLYARKSKKKLGPFEPSRT